jgi:hypothetical protein
METLGGSDITQIFVHNVTSLPNWKEVANVLPGFEAYEERALVFARGHDLVCVSEEVDDQHLAFLSDLGVGSGRNNIVKALKEEHFKPGAILPDLLMHNRRALKEMKKLLRERHEIFLHPLIASTKQRDLARVIETVTGKQLGILTGPPEIVDYAYAKHNAKTKALELGVPVAKGETIRLQLGADGRPLDMTPLEIAINKHVQVTGKVLIRGSCGAAGCAAVIVEENPESIRAALHKIARKNDNWIYLVEVMFDVLVSPNIIMYADPDSSHVPCVSVTDQNLSGGLVHEGNIYPSSAKKIRDMVASAAKLSKWLKAQGYRGLVGFDFGEYLNPETGELQHFLAEINPRTNAAAYPKALMEQLNTKQARRGGPFIEAFLSSEIRTNARSFAELEKKYGHFFFKPDTARGCIPYSIGCLKHGRCCVAVFGQCRTEVMDLYEDLRKSTTTRTAGGLDFRQRQKDKSTKVLRSLCLSPGAKDAV